MTPINKIAALSAGEHLARMEDRYPSAENRPFSTVTLLKMVTFDLHCLSVFGMRGLIWSSVPTLLKE